MGVKRKIQKLGKKTEETAISGLQDLATGNLFNTVSDFVEDALFAFGNLGQTFQSIDSESSKFIKAMGGSRAAMEKMSRSTINIIKNYDIARKYNISTEELIQAQANYVESLGRNVRLAEIERDEQGKITRGRSYENLAAIQNIMGDSTSELLKNLDLFGVSIDGASKMAGRMFNTATKAGISFQKYSKNVVDNFKIAQTYNFKNGLKGLESMAKKATELRINMQDAVAFANKIGTLSEAVETSANLQVLGGNFANFANPMQMLYESLNDMESVQDRMAKMFEGLGTLNKATGEIEISAFNRQRINAAANAMGISPENAMEMIRTSARREEVNAQINAINGGNNINNDLRDLLLNTATFRNGQAVVSVNGKETNISDVIGNTKLQEKLIQETQSESSDIKVIAQDLRSIKDIISGGKNAYRAAIAETEIRANIPTRQREFFGGKDFSPNNIVALTQPIQTLQAQYSTMLNGATQKLIDSTDEFSRKIQEIFTVDSYEKMLGDYIYDFLNTIDFSANRGETRATGGYIGGERHSNGGTPVIAEKGEFIVNRKAMQEYGPIIENMNRNGNLNSFGKGGYPDLGGENFGTSKISIDLEPFGKLDTTISELSKSIGLKNGENGLGFSIAKGKQYGQTISQTSNNGIRVEKITEREIIRERKQKESEKPKEITITLKHEPIILKNENGTEVDIQKLINTPSFIRQFAKEIQEEMLKMARGGKIMETL